MKVIMFSFLLFLTVANFAQIKYVPTEYELIQDAIDACENEGDIVIIEEGKYHQQFSFKGKAITVASRYFLDDDTSHISRTIIDGTFLAFSDSASLVYFNSGEDYSSILCGLTLQNGKGHFEDMGSFQYVAGGAIFVYESGATIRNNIIQFNHAAPGYTSGIQAYGGGVESCYLPAGKKLIVIDNIFRNNKVEGKVAIGGGLDICWNDGEVVVTGNTFFQNDGKSEDSGYGGGLTVYGALNLVLITNNHISANVIEGGFPRGAGIFVENSFYTKIYNNLIINNQCGNSIFSFARGGGIAIHYNPNLPTPSTRKAEIINNTIVRNYAQYEGSGIYVFANDVDIVNNIIRENIDNNNSNIKMRYINNFDVNVSYCNVEGGYEGDGNIDIKPNFSDTVYFYLDENNSQCIDAGNPAEQYFDVSSPFNHSTPRAPAYGTLRNDMGAYGGPYSEWSGSTITNVEEKNDLIPFAFKLYQNYPNPFNPITKIKFTIPSGVGGLTTLKAYNVLGKEVASLINESKIPGIYEVEFDATDFSSGVYFYKLTAGDFVETKKMIFIK